jgi:hypothetical protein
MGCTRGPVGSGRKGRERRGLRYELSVQAGAWGSNLAVLWLWAIKLMNLKELSLNQSPICWRECIPFIDEGDGFTGESERVRMFLSLSGS